MHSQAPMLSSVEDDVQHDLHENKQYKAGQWLAPLYEEEPAEYQCYVGNDHAPVRQGHRLHRRESFMLALAHVVFHERPAVRYEQGKDYDPEKIIESE